MSLLQVRGGVVCRTSQASRQKVCPLSVGASHSQHLASAQPYSYSYSMYIPKVRPVGSNPHNSPRHVRMYFYNPTPSHSASCIHTYIHPATYTRVSASRSPQPGPSVQDNVPISRPARIFGRVSKRFSPLSDIACPIYAPSLSSVYCLAAFFRSLKSSLG